MVAKGNGEHVLNIHHIQLLGAQHNVSLLKTTITAGRTKSCFELGRVFQLIPILRVREFFFFANNTAFFLTRIRTLLVLGLFGVILNLVALEPV